MEDKLITGKQAMEVAVRQEQELQRTNAEIEARKRKEETMAKKLEEKKEDWVNLEQRFSSQQEEIEDKDRKLKKLFTKYQVAQTEIKDLQQEF
jgi:chromosome segregation ATPase